eukprot:TRINITY_DN4325_c0_g1_i3.p2 TRINITY_DN4325_c0_g1~~TRINITY_DN4325_c0_g1_i3.p2  ORF type:complete len:481 (+),score=94.04 TRINITY_DN4325_c0_g1_i3:1856-3298(+)
MNSVNEDVEIEILNSADAVICAVGEHKIAARFDLLPYAAQIKFITFARKLQKCLPVVNRDLLEDLQDDAKRTMGNLYEAIKLPVTGKLETLRRIVLTMSNMLTLLCPESESPLPRVFVPNLAQQNEFLKAILAALTVDGKDKKDESVYSKLVVAAKWGPGDAENTAPLLAHYLDFGPKVMQLIKVQRDKRWRKDEENAWRVEWNALRIKFQKFEEANAADEDTEFDSFKTLASRFAHEHLPFAPKVGLVKRVLEEAVNYVLEDPTVRCRMLAGVDSYVPKLKAEEAAELYSLLEGKEAVDAGPDAVKELEKFLALLKKHGTAKESRKDSKLEPRKRKKLAEGSDIEETAKANPAKRRLFAEAEEKPKAKKPAKPRAKKALTEKAKTTVQDSSGALWKGRVPDGTVSDPIEDFDDDDPPTLTSARRTSLVASPPRGKTFSRSAMEEDPPQDLLGEESILSQTSADLPTPRRFTRSALRVSQ